MSWSSKKLFSPRSRTANFPCRRHSVRCILSSRHQLFTVHRRRVELRRTRLNDIKLLYRMSLSVHVRVSRWILDTYDLSAAFFFFRVVNRYFWGCIAIRNQCKATNIPSWTSQFHQRFNNIRTVLIKYTENCMITHRSAYVRFQGFTCQRRPTLHFGLVSHVCSPPTPRTSART